MISMALCPAGRTDGGGAVTVDMHRVSLWRSNLWASNPKKGLDLTSGVRLFCRVHLFPLTPLPDTRDRQCLLLSLHLVLARALPTPSV